jgi:6-phosphogluconolactonase (cycloisomerase 2 family)
VILTYTFAGTATLSDGAGAPVSVTTGQSSLFTPGASTTYTLSVTNHGVTTDSVIAVTVKTYTPTTLYLVDNGTNEIQRYSVDVTKPIPPATHKLSTSPTGAGPVHAVATPDEKYIYVANNTDASISAFSVGANGGALTTVGGSPFAIAGDTAPAASAVDPAGKTLYVACAASIKVFQIAPSTGALTANPALDTPIPGRTTGDILMHPSGAWLYVADNGNNVVKAYSIDPASGALTLIGDAPSPGGPIGMTLDRAGARLFTRGDDPTPMFDAAIHVFTIDAYTGAATAASSYSGFGFNAYATVSLPFVRGLDIGHHGLAFSKRPGVDVLYNSFSGERASGSSMSGYDLAGSTITGDHSEPLGSPYYGHDWLASVGDSVFLDRGGNALILTAAYQWNQALYYVVKPDGSLMSSFFGDIAVYSGTDPVHGLFVGTLQ